AKRRNGQDWESEFSLDRKARAAAAGGRRVGVLYLESGADHLIGEIDLGALQETKRYGIDEHLGAIASDHQIVLAAGIVEAEIILESRAAAARYSHAQHGMRGIFPEDLEDAPCRPFGEGHGR